MRRLQDLFEKQIQKQIEFASFAADILQGELEKRGIQLTTAQKTQLITGLQKRVEEDDLDEGLSIQIDDAGSLQVTKEGGNSEFEIDISEGAETKLNKILEDLPSILNKSADAESDILLKDIKKQRNRLLRDTQKNQKRFYKQLNKRWGKLLNLLEVFILVSQDIGADFNGSIRGDAEKEISPRFEVLSRSHARSCQVALEILTLLYNGFADGAHARWRTLHEIAVETNIINKNNDDLAVRYLNHDIVQKRQSAITFREHYQELGYESITDEEMQGVDTAYTMLIQQYGKDFANENGWAINIIGKPRPKFKDLEAIADFEHMRPLYKMACLNVHGGSRGLLFRLGLSYEGDENLLLAGPSTNGLANPIQNTAYSLLQITAALLTYDINLDYLVIMKVLHALEQEIFEVTDQIVHENADN